jgi:hypothetical protein
MAPGIVQFACHGADPREAQNVLFAFRASGDACQMHPVDRSKGAAKPSSESSPTPYPVSIASMTFFGMFLA